MKFFTYFDVAETDDEGGVVYKNLSSGTSDAFDVQPGEGLCMDALYNHFQGCPDQVIAKVVDGIIGCADRFVSQFLCGLELRVKHGDVSTASVEGNLLYPRQLVAASPGVRELHCRDPVVRF